MKDTQVKSKILSEAKNLKTLEDADLKQVFICSDRTPKQR